MKKFVILPVVCMFLFISYINAQSFTNYRVATTSTKLCNNYVNAIAIDANGTKWFGIFGGGVSKLSADESTGIP